MDETEATKDNLRKIFNIVEQLDYAGSLRPYDVYSRWHPGETPHVMKEAPKYSDFAFDMPDGTQVVGKIPYLVSLGERGQKTIKGKIVRIKHNYSKEFEVPVVDIDPLAEAVFDN